MIGGAKEEEWLHCGHNFVITRKIRCQYKKQLLDSDTNVIYSCYGVILEALPRCRPSCPSPTP